MLPDSFGIRIETLGCRLNQTESEGLAFIFSKYGFPVFPKESSDILLCVVNTCTVTSKAEQKARRLIRSLLKNHRDACVLVTGCYAELEAKAVETIDERVISFSGKKKDNLSVLPIYIREQLKKVDSLDVEILKNIILEFKEESLKYINSSFPLAQLRLKQSLPKLFLLSSPGFMFHSRATLKVQDGCNNACTFCRIRLARGKAVSLSLYEAIKRIKEIEEKGANEVVLTGVNLSQYESDGCNFTNLLEILLNNTQHIRIRISSLYPETITEEIIPIINEKRICPHFHLSIQSGSDDILQKMNRRYRLKDIYMAINRIRRAKEKPFIGCDIITGFPSESEQDFLKTVAMCESIKFAGIHAFPFSARPGTLAFDMKEKVAERISCERVELLNRIAKKNYDEYLKLCQNDEVFGIVEFDSKNKPFVTTENYLHLPLISELKHHAGEQVKVRIKKDKGVLA